VLDDALTQLPESEPETKRSILTRADSAGATHEFLDALREREIHLSVGFEVSSNSGVTTAILRVPRGALPFLYPKRTPKKAWHGRGYLGAHISLSTNDMPPLLRA
jgi:hypothetical protein